MSERNKVMEKVEEIWERRDIDEKINRILEE